MKLKIFLLAAALTGFNAMAVPTVIHTNVPPTGPTPGGITFTGTETSQNAVRITGERENLTTTSTALKSLNLYNLISNSVANVGFYSTGLTPTNLPANGYIALNPTNTDGVVNGTFYVTNRSGFYYPPSGYDNNGDYYSFVELDTFYNDTNNDLGMVSLGFGSETNSFNGVATENFNTANGDGSAVITVPATFYIHDNPYDYDTSSSPNYFYANQDALALNGNATIGFAYAGGNIKGESISLEGTGAAVNPNGENSLVNGTVSFSQGQTINTSQTGQTGQTGRP